MLIVLKKFSAAESQSLRWTWQMIIVPTVDPLKNCCPFFMEHVGVSFEQLTLAPSLMKDILEGSNDVHKRTRMCKYTSCLTSREKNKWGFITFHNLSKFKLSYISGKIPSYLTEKLRILTALTWKNHICPAQPWPWGYPACCKVTFTFDAHADPSPLSTCHGYQRFVAFGGKLVARGVSW